MNAVEIIIDWLEKNGYDGLYLESECGCFLDDLMPCGDPSTSCEAGYKFWGKFEGEEGWLCGPKKVIHEKEKSSIPRMDD